MMLLFLLPPLPSPLPKAERPVMNDEAFCWIYNLRIFVEFNITLRMQITLYSGY